MSHKKFDDSFIDVWSLIAIDRAIHDHGSKADQSDFCNLTYFEFQVT